MLLALTAASAIGCGDDDGGDPDAGTDTDTDTDVDTDTDTDTDADGDLTTGCGDAIEFALDNASVLSADLTLQTPDDQDFYKFTALADMWIEIYTDIYPDDQTEEPTGFLDPVLELYNEDGSVLLASADDEVPRASMDSNFIYHVATAGTYCVMIQGWENWADQASTEVTTDWDYALFGATLDVTMSTATDDEEPNGTLGEATDIALNEGTYEDAESVVHTYYNGFLFGMAGDAADVDYYTFDQQTGQVSMSIYFRPSGPGSAGVQGHGSTLDLGVVDLLNGDGDVIARLDVALGSEGMSVPIDAGEVVGFMVQGADDWTPGDNDFYAILLVTNDVDNALEEEEALEDGGVTDPNGTDATAEATEPQATTVGYSTYVGGDIDPAGDVDYFAFEVLAGETLNLACGAARSGSGLTGARFAIHSPADAELQYEVESPEADVQWGDLAYGASMVPLTELSAGTYYLRVSATGQDPDVLSTFYRCGLHRITPTDK